MGWHAEAQSGRGVLGELRGESARVRRLSRTGRAQLADSVGTPWQVGNGCRHAVKEVDMRPGCSRIDNRTEHTTICKGSDRFYGGATRGHHAHLLRSVMAVERVQELSSRHSGWYQLAVHRADHCRLLRRYRGQVRFRQPQLGADRLLHQRGVHCRQLARLLPQSPPGRAALNRGGHVGRVFRRGGLGCHCPLLLVERHLLYL